MAMAKFRVGTFNNISRVGLSKFRQSAYQIGALDTDEPISDPVSCACSGTRQLRTRTHTPLGGGGTPGSVCVCAFCIYPRRHSRLPCDRRRRTHA